jgi:DNA-binding transcriptional regulator YiaG
MRHKKLFKPTWATMIDTAIREHGMSRLELARLMRVSTRTIYNWLGGHKKPTGANVALLAYHLKLPAKKLLAEVGREQ